MERLRSHLHPGASVKIDHDVTSGMSRRTTREGMTTGLEREMWSETGKEMGGLGRVGGIAAVPTVNVAGIEIEMVVTAKRPAITAGGWSRSHLPSQMPSV